MHKWWLSNPHETYWLENADRDDLRAELKAPIFDDSGKENWRYTLLREMLPGDVAYRFHR